MKKILLALLLLTSPAFAQTTYSAGDPYGGVSAALAASNDAAVIGITGSRWSTASVTVLGTAGTAGFVFELSTDGTNFVLSPLAKRRDVVTANPTVFSFNNNALQSNAIWEIALPSNCTHFRARVQGAGTATTVSVVGGSAYVPGVPVTGVMYETTSAVNTALDTGTLDFSGWSMVSVEYTTPAGGSGTISRVDDVGTSATIMTVPASAFAYAMFDANPTLNVSAVALPTAGYFGTAPISKRMRFQSAGVAAVTSRIRVEVRR